VEHGANVNSEDIDGKTVLQRTVENNLPDFVGYLVDHGADLNCKYEDGKTVLHRAVESHSPFFVKYLVELGADVSCRDNDSRTVLHSAVQWFRNDYSADIVKYLVEHGADINCKDKDGRTVLHLAVKFSSPSIAIYLIEHSGDGNCKDAEGKSVLHTAVQHESLNIVKYLVEYYGAEVNCKDNYGKTILQSAVDTGLLDIVKCLVEYGADVICENEHDNTTYSDTLKRTGNDTQDNSTTDVNGLGIDILRMAVFKNSVHLVELLLQKGLDVSKAGKFLVNGRQINLFEWSIYHGYYDITKIVESQLKRSVRHREKIQMLKTRNCSDLKEVINTSYWLMWWILSMYIKHYYLTKHCVS
jgi:ankyrin repeat protein